MKLFEFPDTATCAVALAGALAVVLERALAEQSRVTLALSGGRSPQTVLPLLAAIALDWQCVYVTLVDERRVAPDHADSNAGMVQRCFLEQGAAAATFLPLWTGKLAPDDAVTDAQARLSAVLPADIAYLGMGPDGHIASLFPTKNAAAFGGSNKQVILTEAPSPPHNRISMTLESLLQIPHLFCTPPALTNDRCLLRRVGMRRHRRCLFRCSFMPGLTCRFLPAPEPSR